MILVDLRTQWAKAYETEHGHLPLIMHQECYEYLGQPVKIVEANVFDRVDNSEVTIQTWDGNGDTLDFRKLSWRHYPKYEPRPTD